MPAVRNQRRSRRLSRRPLNEPGFETSDADGLCTQYRDEEAFAGQSPRSDATPPSSPSPSSPRASIGSPASSTASDDEDSAFVPRSSHSRKRKDGHTPRPPNAFILFRSDFWEREKSKSNIERDHRQISILAGIHWHKLSEEKRVYFQRKAEEAKREHARQYPDYRYTPSSKKEVKKRKNKRDTEAEKNYRRRIATARRQGREEDELEDAAQKMNTGRGVSIGSSSTPSPATSSRASKKKPRSSPRRSSAPKSSPRIDTEEKPPRLTTPAPEPAPIPPHDLQSLASKGPSASPELCTPCSTVPVSGVVHTNIWGQAGREDNELMEDENRFGPHSHYTEALSTDLLSSWPKPIPVPLRQAPAFSSSPMSSPEGSNAELVSEAWDAQYTSTLRRMLSIGLQSPMLSGNPALPGREDLYSLNEPSSPSGFVDEFPEWVDYSAGDKQS